MGTSEQDIVSRLARACGYLATTPDGGGDPSVDSYFSEGLVSLSDILRDPSLARSWNRETATEVSKNIELTDPIHADIAYVLTFVSSDPANYMEVGFDFPDNDDLNLGDVRRAFVRFCNSLDIPCKPDQVALSFGEVST